VPPISQPLIAGVSRFWFSSEIIWQPPSRLCGCGKCSVLSSSALPAFCPNFSGVLLSSALAYGTRQEIPA
jgi:hypothetical protein